MEECHSRQLRPKTMLSYEHTLRRFSFWLTGRKKISKIEDTTEAARKRIPGGYYCWMIHFSY